MRNYYKVNSLWGKLTNMSIIMLIVFLQNPGKKALPENPVSAIQDEKG